MAKKSPCELGDQKLTTTAKDGNWRVDLKPLTAGGPLTMTISGENTVTVNNLLVGEVWVCSGQSNMEFPFAQTDSVKEETPKADHPQDPHVHGEKDGFRHSQNRSRWLMGRLLAGNRRPLLGGRLLLRPRSLSETRHPRGHDPHLVGWHSRPGMDQRRRLRRRPGSQGLRGCGEKESR